MNQVQYQAQAEEVVNDLKEFYVFLERTEFLESLLSFQRSSILRKAKLEAEAVEDSEEARKVLKTSLINAMDMSDEEVMATILVKMQEQVLETGEEFLRKLLN